MLKMLIFLVNAPHIRLCTGSNQACQIRRFGQESPDFLTFLLIKILLNSGADFKDFLPIFSSSEGDFR